MKTRTNLLDNTFLKKQAFESHNNLITKQIQYELNNRPRKN